MEPHFLKDSLKHPTTLITGIESRLVADIFYHAKGVLLGTLVLFAVNFVFYFPVLPVPILIVWSILMLSSCVIRNLSLRRYERSEDSEPPQRWHREAVLAYPVMATGWGLLGVSSVILLPTTESIVAIVTVAGITGSAAATTSASPILFKLVAYIALAPLAIATLLNAQDAMPYVGVMTACYLVVLNRASRRIHETLLRSVTFGLENEDLVETLAKLSTIDSLTGLSNRRALNQGFEGSWVNAAQEGHRIGFILCDIDHFKEYNDTYGHLAGDHCLQQVAQALNSAVRGSDLTTARYGGEEFAVLLPNCNKENLVEVSERLRATVEALAIPHSKSPVSSHVTMSVGASYIIPTPSSEADELMRAADNALYQAKEAGRNCVQINHTVVAKAH